MEGLSDQSKPNDGHSSPEQENVDVANDFLATCDRLSSEYDSGFYWDDVQRALRIAAGLEKWPN